MIFHEAVQREEQEFDRTLRPGSFAEFIGQDRIRENLRIAITAAKRREEPLDTFSSSVLRAWARPPSRTSSPRGWGPRSP